MVLLQTVLMFLAQNGLYLLVLSFGAGLAVWPLFHKGHVKAARALAGFSSLLSALLAVFNLMVMTVVPGMEQLIFSGLSAALLLLWSYRYFMVFRQLRT